MLGLIRRWRRRRLLREPMDSAWIAILESRVPFFAELEGPLRARFLRDLRVFSAEKYWIGAGGLEITDEIRVTVAAAAVRLILHLHVDFYNRLTEIIVYPSDYVHPDAEDGSVILGEAHSWGTVVLSWEAVVEGLRNPLDGHDTATHEFAHVLDRAGGSFNGTPELRAREHYRAWAAVMSRNYRALRKRRGKSKVMRSYGATNEAEFFAVATEAFFEKPGQMRRHSPDLYDEMRQFYGFDPDPDD